MFDPAHPGELVRETIKGIASETGQRLTVDEIATGLGISRKTLSALINSKQSISPEMAIRLATAFNTSEEFWLQAQKNYDLARARKRVDTKSIKVFSKGNKTDQPLINLQI
jgi:addiction module HigA family antidote